LNLAYKQKRASGADTAKIDEPLEAVIQRADYRGEIDRLDIEMSSPEPLLSQNIPQLVKVPSKIKDRFVVIRIEYKPPQEIEQSDSVSILGEFNQWLPEVMSRYTLSQIAINPKLSNTFFYRTRVLKGFGYRYHFSVGEKYQVDTTKESAEGPNGQLTNKILAANEHEEINEADMETQL